MNPVTYTCTHTHTQYSSCICRAGVEIVHGSLCLYTLATSSVAGHGIHLCTQVPVHVMSSHSDGGTNWRERGRGRGRVGEVDEKFVDSPVATASRAVSQWLAS